MHEMDVINKILSGETEAYAELVRQYHSKVIRLCHLMLRNETEAQDAAQDTYVNLAKNSKKLEEVRNLKYYVTTVATNICFNILKREKRRKHLPLYESDAVCHAKPIDSAINNESIAKLSDAINYLPNEYRIVVTLRYLQQLDFKTIANQNNVRSAAKY